MLELHVHSFGACLTPTHTHSEWSLNSTSLFRSALESHLNLFGACLNSTSLFRRRNYAPLTQAFTGGVPPLERRGAYLRPRKLDEKFGAYLRPRKLDEKLSRHGLGARRVALLAPRATFSLYWSPLDYVSARLKLFQKRKKSISRILGGQSSIPSGGGVPKGRRGSNTPLSRGRIPHLISLNTT